MALKLNATREAYQEFYGRNVDQMPRLIADGRVPMNAAQLMQRRLDVRNADEDVKGSWMNNYFDTGDAVVYHPGGRFKIVLDAQPLREMTADTPRRGGALVLGEDVYKALQGEEFKKGKLGKINGLMAKEVKAHPVWKVLARDQELLDDFVDYIFAQGKEQFNYDNAMGVFPSSAGVDAPEMRAWFVGGLEDNRSGAGDGDGLGYGGRLVGIAPEALSATNKGVSAVKTYTMADLQAVDRAMKSLEGTLHPDILKPFAYLRKKL